MQTMLIPPGLLGGSNKWGHIWLQWAATQASFPPPYWNSGLVIYGSLGIKQDSRPSPARGQRCALSPTLVMLPFSPSKPPTAWRGEHLTHWADEPQKGRKQSWSVMLEAHPGKRWLVTNEGRDPVNTSCSNTLPGKWGFVAGVQLA